MKLTPKKSTATREAGLSGYAPFLAVVKNRIRAAQVKATLSANAELIHLYWDIGRAIVAMQEKEGWGAGVIPRMARDIANDMPEVKGFSERNIGRMIVFYREYPDLTAILPTASAKLSDSLKVQQPAAQLPAIAKVPQAVAQIQGLEILPTLSAKTLATGDEIATEPTPLAQLPWSHHILLIQKVKDLQTRFWYARQAVEIGWSHDVLALQIDSRAYDRRGKAVHNFHATLPPPQSDLAELVGAASKSVVYQWESGKRVPSRVFWNRIDDLDWGVNRRRQIIQTTSAS